MEDRNIEKLIRESLKAEQPSSDFTDKIMGKIQALDSKEDLVLRSLLKKGAIDSPSVNFTDRVMAQVEKTQIQMISSPLISKKIWMLISVCITSIFIYVMFTGESNAATSEVINGTMNKANGLLTNSMTFELPAILTSPLFGLSIFALSSLLFLDYFLKNKKVSMSI